MDKSSFFIRPYHIREEDKKTIDREMKQLCYLGILKEGFSPYSSPVMLISHKLTQDKRVVTDFKHLNMRIAKNNLAYPLVTDTFLVLGNSKCEVLLVLDLKIHFIHYDFQSRQRNFEVFYHIWKCLIYLLENAYGIKYIPIHLAILYKHNFRLFGNEKTLQSNNG